MSWRALRVRNVGPEKSAGLRTRPGVVAFAGLAVMVAMLQPPVLPDARAAGPTATTEHRVSTSSDDAEQAANGAVNRTSTDLELVFDQGSNQTVGVRFAAVNVPPKANVTSAWVQFTVDEVNTVATSVTIRGQAAAAAPTFSTASFGISNRPTTGASVAWSPPQWTSVGAAGTAQRTPDLSAVVREIVNLDGWASGNPMVLMLSGFGERTAEAYDGVPAAAPLLHVEYELSGVSIAAFSAAPSDPVVGTPSVFSWSVSDAAGGQVDCSLDVDDDGTVDYTIAGCTSSTSASHTYTSVGSRTARLTATNAAGDTRAATTVVTVLSRTAATTFERRVASAFDDAEESATGSVSNSSSDLELAYDGSSQAVGMRFAAVAVPARATISKAWVQFAVDETSSTATALSIRAEATGNAANYGSAPRGISSRPTVPGSVAWQPPAWTTVGQAGPAQRTPDLAALIQQVVDQSGWVSGNALGLVVTGTGTGRRTAEAFDGVPAAAPLLHVEYTRAVIIDSLTASPANPAPGQQVTFTWSVSHVNSRAVSCTLDVDGDATTDYSIDRCDVTTSQQHTYPTAAYYQARLTATDGVEQAQASTLVNVVDPQTVVIAAAGDIACDPTSTSFNGGLGTTNNCHMLATSDLVLAMNPTAVLTLGDNVYESGTLAQFQQSYDLSWGRFKGTIRPGVGNHEYQTPNAAGYFQYFGQAAGDPTKGYYSFDLGRWHIVAINSNCWAVGGCTVGSPQAQWLTADLAAHPATCTLAYWHHARFSSGAHGNTPDTRDLWAILMASGADVALTSHDHDYERFAPQDADGLADPNGLVEFVVGTGGKNLTVGTVVQPNSLVRNNATFGVLKVTLRPTSYTWDFVPEAGKTFTDTGTADCH